MDGVCPFSNDSRIGESYDRFGDLVIVISFRVGKDVMQFLQTDFLLFSIDNCCFT